MVECSKANPDRRSAPGTTRWLENRSSSASSWPRSNRNAGLGTGNSAGRWRARPRARLNSAFVTGAGPTRLTGPSRSWSSSQAIARTSSVNEIQLQILTAVAEMATQAELEGQQHAGERGRLRVENEPRAHVNDAAPGAPDASSVAASHAPASSARKPSPGPLDSSSSSSPRSP